MGELPEGSAPSYHDLHITTPTLQRTSIFNLPFGLEVVCNRVSGWQLVDVKAQNTVAGEFQGPEDWPVLDVKGIVIVGSRPPAVA